MKIKIILKENKTSNFEYNLNIINNFFMGSMSYKLIKENFETNFGMSINSFLDFIKMEIGTNNKENFYNILRNDTIKKPLGQGGWGCTFLLKSDMVLKIGFSRSPNYETDSFEELENTEIGELKYFSKLQQKVFDSKGKREDLMIHDFGKINNILYYVLESKLHAAEFSHAAESVEGKKKLELVDSFFTLCSSFMRKIKVPIKSYPKTKLLNEFVQQLYNLQQSYNNKNIVNSINLYENYNNLFLKAFDYVYNRVKLRGLEFLEDLKTQNIGFLNDESDIEKADWVQFDF